MSTTDRLLMEDWAVWWKSLGRSDATFHLMRPEVERFVEFIETLVRGRHP